MHRMRAITVRPLKMESLPASSFVGPTPHGRYKSCFNEQTTIAGKKNCYNEYQMEKSEDQ